MSGYSSVVEDQHRVIMERRQALLHGHEVPDVWKNAAAERYATLVASSGEDNVERAERTVTLFHIDRIWREHLATAPTCEKAFTSSAWRAWIH